MGNTSGTRAEVHANREGLGTNTGSWRSGGFVINQGNERSLINENDDFWLMTKRRILVDVLTLYYVYFEPLILTPFTPCHSPEKQIISLNVYLECLRSERIQTRHKMYNSGVGNKFVGMQVICQLFVS